jgi:hypothetical protein
MQPAPELPAPGRTALRRGILCAAVVAAVAVPPVANATGLTAQRKPAVAPVAPAAAAPCAPKELPTLGGSQGSALAVSSSGLVAGFADDGSGTPQPVLWSGGAAQKITTGLTNVSPTGVNARGEVVGVGVDPSSLDQVGWQWRAGKLTRLRTLAGTVALPAAISDTGRIVGALAADDDGAANPTSGEAPERAASWASAAAPPSVLAALPGDVGAHAYGVNGKGVVVGSSQASDHFTPVVWDNGGKVTELPALGGAWGIARAIDDTGTAVGSAVAGTGEPQALTWDVGRHPTPHGKAGGRRTQGTGLVHGRAVGTTEVRGADGVDRPQAVLFDAGANASTLPPLSGDPGAGVTAAADSTGVAVGFSSGDSASRTPMTWTCAP